MSAPVDVLGAMRKGEAYCYDAGASDAARALKEARAAVAELVEAHRNLLDYVLSEAEARDYNPPADTVIVADSMAALARVGGES